jgi:tripartite-type tricarboxylate transporter receptor subunit TctC
MKSGHKLWSAAIALFVAIVTPHLPAQAQDTFPNRPIRFVNPYPAGGPLDAIVRRLAEAVSPILGQAVIVENRAGANGTLGTAEVLKNPDGYTYLVTTPDPLIHMPILMNSVPYNPRKDFFMMTQVSLSVIALVANADMPATFSGIIAAAKEKPGSVSFGSFGNGSQPHLISEIIARQDGVQLNHVPYRGAGPALQDVLAKQISFSFTAPIAAAPMARDGKLKIAAATGSKRTGMIPDVPTFAELGYTHPLLEIRYWAGVFAPAAAPKDATEKVLKAIQTAVATPAFSQFIASTGWEVVNNGPAEFAAAFNKEYDIVEKVASEYKIPKM